LFLTLYPGWKKIGTNIQDPLTVALRPGTALNAVQSNPANQEYRARILRDGRRVGEQHREEARGRQQRHCLSGPSGPMEHSSPSYQVSKLPNLVDEDGCGELCPLVLPGVARCSCQQITRAPAHRQRLPQPVPSEGFR
jgi:hypothetical protein